MPRWHAPAFFGCVAGERGGDGRRLTPAEQVHLFERGARQRNGLSANPSSAGYGLAIAKEFVDRMGGRLWSDSEPGRGACFSFRLPYHP